MLIQGVYEDDHIIRDFIAREYAFSVDFEDGQEIRCAHYKGLWTFAHLKSNKLIRAYLMDDTGASKIWDQGQDDNPILEGFIAAQYDILRRNKGIEPYRDMPARVLLAVFRLFVGHTNRIRTINVLQPGRNATVDMKTGDFSLSPC